MTRRQNTINKHLIKSINTILTTNYENQKAVLTNISFAYFKAIYLEGEYNYRWQLLI